MLDELGAVKRLSKRKEILRAAGRQSRNTLLSNYQASFAATRMAHGSVARAVMNNDKELAMILIGRLIGGADYLAIREGKGTVRPDCICEGCGRCQKGSVCQTSC